MPVYLFPRGHTRSLDYSSYGIRKGAYEGQRTAALFTWDMGSSMKSWEGHMTPKFTEVPPARHEALPALKAATINAPKEII